MNIYEIAKQCGVSVATVSRVINGKSDVSAETRANILAVIDQSGFKPQIARNLHNAVCLFVANIGRDSFDTASPYVSRIINGLGSELFSAGYILSVAPLWQNLMDPDRFKLYCRQHRIAGAVVVNLHDGHKFLGVPVEDFPLVFFSVKSPFPWIKTVSSEGFGGAYDAVSYLIRMGHRRILHVGGNFTMSDHRSRRDGYLKALQDNGIPLEPWMSMEHHSLTQTDYRMQIVDMMRDPATRPTAIFVCDDFEVIRLCSILDDIGLSIPDDVSIVGFDDYDFSRFLSPPLTTVNQPVMEMGVSSGKIILDMINKRNGDEVHDVLHKTKLVVRKSVKALG